MIIPALLAAAALTTSAAPTTPATAQATAKSAPSRYAVRYDEKKDRYCLRERGATAPTGSRLILERCKTRGDWAADGLTIAQR
jgi:hypothetical protein